MTTETLFLTTGAKVNVATAGDGDELILFLHAVGGDHRSWEPQLASFSGRYRVAALDFRGHGTSKAPSGSDTVHVPAFADDVVSLIPLLGYRKAHLVGLSMGGVVALEAWKRNPALVQSLVLANTWAHHPDAAAKTIFMREQLAKMSLAESAAALVPGLFAPGTDPAIVARAIEIEGGKTRDVFLSSWTSMFAADHRDTLPRVDVPVLLLGGSEDRVTPTDPLLVAIADQIPTAQLLEIPGAGHFSNLDHPQEFDRALAAHLRRARSLESQRASVPQRRQQMLVAATVAQGLMAILNHRGVDAFFSNSGTDFTPIIDALARYEGEEGFRLETIVAPHENTAIAMAHGYALLTGRPQAVMAHVNVGTANMGLGIINAQRSKIPMLVMAGKTPWTESEIDGCRTNFVQWGQDTYDQGAYFREFTKWDHELKGGFNLETVLDRALAIAESDPKGPVYLTLPKEALCRPVANVTVTTPPRQRAHAAGDPPAEALARATRLLAQAKNPLVVTAELGRTPGGPEALVQLAGRNGISVVEHGKRNFFNFPTEHPMHLGFAPEPFVEKADLILAIDTHVPWIPAFASLKTPPTVVQIGVDPLFQDLPMRSFPVDIALAGDSARTLRLLNERLDSVPGNGNRRDRFAKLSVEHRHLFLEAREAARADGTKGHITKRYLSWCIGQVVDDETVIFNEYDLDPTLVPRRVPGTWFENSIASGLGWSLGAALGAQLASPWQTMLVAVGDGSYFFNTPLSAHYVAGAYGLPILIVVFNDSAWSTIKKSYKSTTKDGWAQKRNSYPLCDFDLSIQFEKLAESAGGVGLQVSTPGELSFALQKALRTVRVERKHVLLNVICERDG